MNALFSWSPYQYYRGCFNFSSIFVASRQSGADHPASGIKRDTYFNSTFDLSDRVIYIPLDSTGQGRVDELLQTMAPDCQLAVLLVNDLTPGGSDGFGHTAICSVAPSSSDILRHETGHVLANLGDEYDWANPGYPDAEEPNTTREKSLALLKWRQWVDPATPIPTPPTFDFSDTVGLFEGAHYHSNGWYRPKLNCGMRELAVPFCEVCQEALVLSFYSRMRPVDKSAPLNSFLNLTNSNSITFSVSPIGVASVGVQWRTNSSAVPAATNMFFSVDPASLMPRSNQVSVTVQDTTPFVRSDPGFLLKQTVEWVVFVNSAHLRLESPMLLPDFKFLFKVSGASSSGFWIQSSSDLKSWQNVSTNTAFTGEIWVTNSSTSSQQYYRALAR